MMLKTLDVEAIDKFAQDLFDSNLVPGVALGLSKDGEVIFEKGYGYRDVENRLEVNLDTVFGIASLTKSFSCMAILQLQEAGMLSVHNPVVDYLPEFKIKNSDVANQMTIHHFMTHSTGLPPMPFMSDSMVRAINEDLTEEQQILKLMAPDENEPLTYEELMEKISKLDLELFGSPGTVFSYCNECFCLLGAIVERVSGMPYEEYVKENILEPAGLKNTGFVDEDFIGNTNMTIPYVIRNHNGMRDVMASPRWWNAPAMRATGLLRSTVNDLLRYTEIFRTGGKVGDTRILSPVSVKQMLTPYVPTNMSPNQYYGYGLMITLEEDGTTFVQHNGNAKGVTSTIQFNPEKGLAAVGLSNLQMAPVFGMASAAMNVAQGKEPGYSRISDEVYPYTIEQLDEFVGIYDSNDRGPAVVKREGENLVLTSYGSTLILEGLDKDLFKIKGARTDDTVPFFRDKAGHIYRLSFGGRLHVKKD